MEKRTEYLSNFFFYPVDLHRCIALTYRRGSMFPSDIDFYDSLTHYFFSLSLRWCDLPFNQILRTISTEN